jgi:hypothetical protein
LVPNTRPEIAAVGFNVTCTCSLRPAATVTETGRGTYPGRVVTIRYRPGRTLGNRNRPSASVVVARRGGDINVDISCGDMPGGVAT